MSSAQEGIAKHLHCCPLQAGCRLAGAGCAKRPLRARARARWAQRWWQRPFLFPYAPCLRSLSHSFTLDFLIGFEREDDARRVLAVLAKRLGRFGLALYPDKTRLVPFGRPPQGQQRGTGPATFDFLGFTCSWARSRKGRWGRYGTTRRASLRRAKQALYDWCRRHRHQPVKAQHAARRQRVRGHCNSFGVSGTVRSLLRLVEATKRAWDTWLCRRSQRTRLTWERCGDVLQQSRSPAHGSRSASGAARHESHQRKSRMVEISSSGSGEGPGRVTARPTLQRYVVTVPSRVHPLGWGG